MHMLTYKCLRDCSAGIRHFTAALAPLQSSVEGDYATDASGTSRKPSPSGLPREKEYECLNPGAGGPPGQQQERDKPNPEVTRDDGGAGIAGSQNEDVKGRKPRGPRGAST